MKVAIYIWILLNILCTFSVCTNGDAEEDADALYMKIAKANAAQLEREHHSFFEDEKSKLEKVADGLRDTKNTIWDDFKAVGNTAHGLLTLIVFILILFIITILMISLCWACTFLRNIKKSCNRTSV